MSARLTPEQEDLLLRAADKYDRAAKAASINGFIGSLREQVIDSNTGAILRWIANNHDLVGPINDNAVNLARAVLGEDA